MLTMAPKERETLIAMGAPGQGFPKGIIYSSKESVPCDSSGQGLHWKMEGFS